MSKMMQWVIGIIVVAIIVVGLLWWMGVFGVGSASQQPAAVAAMPMAQPRNTAIPDSVVDANVAAIDLQIKTIGVSVSALGSATPTKAGILAAVGNFQAVGGLMTQLSGSLQARITNAKTSNPSGAAAAQAALTDLVHQVANMTSQVGSANVNTSGTKSSTTLSQSVSELVAAQGYLKAGRADLNVVIANVGIK